MSAATRLTIIGLVVLVGCEAQPTAPKADSVTTVAVPGASQSGMAQMKKSPVANVPQSMGSQYTDEQLPVPGDFEPQAIEEITEDNYQQKLAAIEEEVSGKPATSASAQPSAAPSAAPKAPPPKKEKVTNGPVAPKK